MITKYTRVEEILETKFSKTVLSLDDATPGDYLNKFSSLVDEPEEQDGYLYVRCRAISSRVNKNNDGWPSQELAKAYKTFLGRPNFIDHNNDNPERTRGVIVDARLHVEDDEKLSALDPYYSTAPESHKPPTWIELLIEVDGKTFPKLAKAIRNNDIDAVSMGANILRSVCSVCSHEATVPAEYCSHIESKGAEFEIEAADGSKSMKKAYEDCYDINFFEISFVFDPADPTALISDKKGNIKTASTCPTCNGSNTDKVLKEAWDNDNLYKCLDCNKNYRFATDLEEVPSEEDGPYDWGEAEENIESLPEGRIDEEEQVFNWRLENLLQLQDFQGEKLSPDVAQLLAQDFHWDWHSLRDLLDKNWPLNYAIQVTTHKKTADPIMNQEYERQLNYEPQSEAITAPPEVNTLRKEFPCPNCKSDTLVSDPDGLMKCPTCSFVQPPNPLDAPDLSVHQRYDAEQAQEDKGDQQQHPLDAVRIIHRQDSSDFNQQPSTPGLSPNAIKSSITSKEINEMKWSTVENKAIVDTNLGNPKGINFDTYQEFRNRGLVAKVTYPNGEVTSVPFDNPIKDMVLAVKCQKEANVEAADLLITVETPLKDVEDVLELIQTGALKPIKKVLTPSRPIQTEDPTPTKVISDQPAPIESSVDETEEVEEIEETKLANCKSCEHDGCSGDCGSCDACSEKEASEKESSNESNLLAIMSIADELVELGLVHPDQKLALVAQLEGEGQEGLEARKAMVSLVKESGLQKPAKKMGVSSIPSLMSFDSKEASNNGSTDVPIESIFM